MKFNEKIIMLCNTNILYFQTSTFNISSFSIFFMCVLGSEHILITFQKWNQIIWSGLRSHLYTQSGRASWKNCLILNLAWFSRGKIARDCCHLIILFYYCIASKKFMLNPTVMRKKVGTCKKVRILSLQVDSTRYIQKSMQKCSEKLFDVVGYCS